MAATAQQLDSILFDNSAINGTHVVHSALYPRDADFIENYQEMLQLCYARQSHQPTTTHFPRGLPVSAALTLPLLMRLCQAAAFAQPAAP
jgi:hypothetical protein